MLMRYFKHEIRGIKIGKYYYAKKNIYIYGRNQDVTVTDIRTIFHLPTKKKPFHSEISSGLIKGVPGQC